MKLKQLLPALAAGSALVSGGAMAATDGSLATGVGATSTGTSVISLTVPDLIRISNLNDIAMAYTAGSGATGTDDVCVYRNGAGGYGVTAQSSNDAAGVGTTGAFTLANGASTVTYAVDWAGNALTEDTLLSGLTTAETTSTTCGGTPNITVTVTATDAQVGAATATGAHTDTLSLIVTAE